MFLRGMAVATLSSSAFPSSLCPNEHREAGAGAKYPPCNSHALVQATVGVGTVFIWYLILLWYQM